MVVHSASLCLHTRLSLGTGDDLHKRMRFHASSRSPSPLVCITIILTLDDVTWTTSPIPTCPLQHWAPPDVDTAHRLHYARLTLALTLDDVTGVASVIPSPQFQHYACADISIALAVTWHDRTPLHHGSTRQHASVADHRPAPVFATPTQVQQILTCKCFSTSPMTTTTS